MGRLDKLAFEPKGAMATQATLSHATPSSGPRILLVDDEPRILNFLSRGLRAEGFQVEVAAEGRDGLQRALTESYDLVVLDLLMPGMDGTAVLRGILARKPRQQVIVLSALTDIQSKVECLELGA